MQPHKKDAHTPSDYDFNGWIRRLEMASEQGLTSPSLETAQKLCKARGVSMDDVCGE